VQNYNKALKPIKSRGVSFKRFRSEATSYFLVFSNKKVTKEVPPNKQAVNGSPHYSKIDAALELAGAQTTTASIVNFLRGSACLNGYFKISLERKKGLKVGGCLFILLRPLIIPNYSFQMF
jgi:hypothetical protein